MPNFKKFVALSLGAVCLMTSCNHTVNADGAKKFIEANYTGTDTYKGIKSVQLTYKVTCTDNVKDYMVEQVRTFAKEVECKDTEYKEGSLSFTCQSISKTSPTYTAFENRVKTRLVSKVIDEYESNPDIKTKVYTTSGKELSIYTVDHSEAAADIYTHIDNTNIYNSNGNLRYERNVQHSKAKEIEIIFTKIYIATLE